MIPKTLEEIQDLLKFIEKIKERESDFLDDPYYQGRVKAFQFVLDLFHEDFSYFDEELKNL